MDATTPGHLQSVGAMERFHQNQWGRARQAIYPIQTIKTERLKDAYTADIEMESVGFHNGWSEIYDHEDDGPYGLEQENIWLPLLSTTEGHRMVEHFAAHSCLRDRGTGRF